MVMSFSYGLAKDALGTDASTIVFVAVKFMGDTAKILIASQWTLMWRKFRKHRLAMLGGSVTILIYLVVLFAEFLAPFEGTAFSSTIIQF